MDRLGVGLATKDITIFEFDETGGWNGTWLVTNVKGNHAKRQSKAKNKLNEEVTSFEQFTIPIDLDLKEKEYRIALGKFTAITETNDYHEPISCDSCDLFRDMKRGVSTGKYLVKV